MPLPSAPVLGNSTGSAAPEATASLASAGRVGLTAALVLFVATSLLGGEGWLQGPPLAAAVHSPLRRAAAMGRVKSSESTFEFSGMERCIFEDLRRHQLFDYSWLQPSRGGNETPPRLPPVYVVSFAGGLARQELTRLHLDALGIPAALTSFEFDASNFNASEKQTCWMTPTLIARNVVRPSDLSVAMKHTSIAYDIVVQNHSHGLVLEDDAEFQEAFVDILVNIIKVAPRGWDAIFVSECYPGMVAASWGTGGEYVAPRLWRMPGARCSDAYLLSQEGARKLLLSMPLAEMAMDWHFGHLKDPVFLWTDPFIVRGDPSLPSALNPPAVTL
jgi:GR25 family glycosyltransferase involved in LPS biosynthesis